MSLLNKVKVARRFQRSIRIDTDLHDPRALEGFICPKTSADVLQTMAKHAMKTGQAAFTWTGPYGSGKSSLVIALSAVLNGDASLRKEAADTLGKKMVDVLWEAFPPKAKGWRILPVVGQRERPAQVIGEALIANGYVPKGKRRWSDDEVLEALTDVAAEPLTHGGLVVFLDEMGKFLEGAAHDNADIYLFQRLAEMASRSGGRLLVIGILHQAFDEYAQKLARDLRDEWAKVQGRFVDMSVNIAGDEQLDLLARAIQSEHSKSKKPSSLAAKVAEAIKAGRPSAGNDLALMLEHCWPLHPVVAALLGPISRRRFGQNQRSLFGFLNSAEPFGFQDFLRDASEDDIFGPDRLWDYLRNNLEPAILASPDGHKWAMAVDAVERCGSAEHGTHLHVQVLKSLALIDLFRERSGLSPSVNVLSSCLAEGSEAKVKAILKDLEKWSLIIFRKHVEAYAIYAGSDFDIEQALQEELASIREINFKDLRSLAGLQPVLAKRHYHRTGALRWFDVDLAPLSDVASYLEAEVANNGAMGRFLLVIPTNNETKPKADKYCQQIADVAKDQAMIGLSSMSWHVVQLARELIALTKISSERPELAGDGIARREVMARLSGVRVLLENNLQKMFDTATWYSAKDKPQQFTAAELNILASKIADTRYEAGPRITNELLNRQKTSPNAVTAQKALLKEMVKKEGEERLGIQGFPAEGGLFDSIIMKAGIYSKGKDGWQFQSPTPKNDPCNLLPMWNAGIAFLEENSVRTVGMDELFDLWSKPPFGLKSGLQPVIGVAFFLARRDKLAFYRQGIFQAKFTDFDIDLLTNDPSDIQLRWMNLSDLSKKLLSEMALVVREIDTCNALVNLEPIDVARGLVAIFQTLHPWTKRTMQLSSNAQRVRDLFKHAIDPNKFIFDDIPSLFTDIVGKKQGEREIAEIVARVRDGLQELTQAYGLMLENLQQMMLAELQVPNSSPQALADLRDRAANVRQLSGDFRLEAFVGRLSQFKATSTDIEGIAGLANNKPLKDWVDSDLAQAKIEIADLCQKFIRVESFARVKGRTDKRQAMAVVVGMDGRPTPVSGEFSITDNERKIVNDLVHQVELAFGNRETLGENVILAALAEISARYLARSAEQGLLGNRMRGDHA